MRVCALCFQRFECPTNHLALVCFGCVMQARRFRAEGCLRCGLTRCVGCAALPEFERVQCLFQLHKASANLLVDAKDRQCEMAIALMRELYLPDLISRVRELQAHFRYDAIVLAPMRFLRFLMGGWHVLLDVFDAVCATSVVVFPIVFAAKHAPLPARLRRSRSHEQLLMFGDRTFSLKPASRILLVDDVLTSGTTALAVQRHYAAKSSETVWHYVSLFRTPQKSDDSS